LAYAFSPRGYVVSEGSIGVQRLIGTVRVPLQGIRELRRTGAKDFEGCIRLWGSGGLFGYYGLFRTTALGKCTWYVTNRTNAVAAIGEVKTALFSPDDVDGFLSTIRSAAHIPEASTAPSPFSALPADRPWRRTGALVAFGLLLLLAPLSIVFLYAPGPPGYTLTRDTLAIHDRFYPVTLNRESTDSSAVRIVDLADEPDWRPVRRTNGFANSHYQAGWFRLANGKTVRMYRAGGSRLVLLPPQGDGAAVLYELREPDAFLQEIRQEWSQ